MILMKHENRRHEEEKYEYECAGTIIGDKHILTAAQCVWCVANNDCDQSVAIGDMIVVAGEDDMAKLYDDNMELITSGDASLHEVKRIVMHPKYTYPDNKWDIALLELKTSLINDKIGAARLPPPGMMYAKEWVKTGGWGSDSVPEQKHRIIEAYIKSEDECKQLFPDINYSQDLQLCAKQQNFQCKGDKGARVLGAGLLFTQWEHPIVIGVVSGTRDTGCSLFSTKTEEVLSWIDTETNIRPKSDVFTRYNFPDYIKRMSNEDIYKIIFPALYPGKVIGTNNSDDDVSTTDSIGYSLEDKLKPQTVPRTVCNGSSQTSSPNS